MSVRGLLFQRASTIEIQLFVSFAKRTSIYRNVTCSRHDIAEQLSSTLNNNY